MNEFSISPASSEDFESVNALMFENEYYDAHPDYFRPSPRYFFKPGRFESFVSGDADGDETLLVARTGTKVVGVIYLEVEYEQGNRYLRSIDFVRVNELNVAAEYRKQGVAQSLMRAAEDWARSRDITRIELSVYAFRTEAKALYDKLGYAPLRQLMYKQLAIDKLV